MHTTPRTFVDWSGGLLPPDQSTAAVGVHELDDLAVATLRTLSIDTVEQAQSGHPGAPMGMAPMAYVLWAKVLRHAPSTPGWPDRDRFVLSAGHASALLYSLLHLTGYDLSLEDLRAFRQLGSRTPGHPERGLTPGVEVTTGPLGQGVANAVGMAMAERRLADEFNKPGHTVIDHRVFVLCGDGDLQEGITAEAASLAGHLGLGKLICLYDDNQVQLDGPTSEAWSEDVAARYRAYGWHVEAVADGNDLVAIGEAIDAAIGDPRPSLVAVRTHLGYGAPTKQDTSRAHGSPLGGEEAVGAKRAYGWDPDRTFHVPSAVRERLHGVREAGDQRVAEWHGRMERYRDAYPHEAAELERRLAGLLPSGWDAGMPEFAVGTEMATRSASGAVLRALAMTNPELIGGSADLASSNHTDIPDGGVFSAAMSGRVIRFGVREHAMAAIANGIAAHGGLRPFVATFLAFSDYARPAIRLAALSGLPVIFVFTHDSIAVGEDGPTHQPVEQLAALRLIPNLWVLRPGDANETAAAWRVAMERRDGPVALILGRQGLPTLPGSGTGAPDGVARGAYVVAEPGSHLAGAAPDLILIASGSEVSLASAVAVELGRASVAVQVVSMPSWELFAAQDQASQEAVLPSEVTARLSIEAGATAGWDRWVGSRGAMVGIDGFGASGPASAVLSAYGFDAASLVDVARGVIAGSVTGRVPTPTVVHATPEVAQ
jgi:transketolase